MDSDLARRLMWITRPVSIGCGCGRIGILFSVRSFRSAFFWRTAGTVAPSDLRCRLLRLLGTRRQFVGAHGVPRALSISDRPLPARRPKAPLRLSEAVSRRRSARARSRRRCVKELSLYPLDAEGDGLQIQKLLRLERHPVRHRCALGRLPLRQSEPGRRKRPNPARASPRAGPGHGLALRGGAPDAAAWASDGSCPNTSGTIQPPSGSMGVPVTSRKCTRKPPLEPKR
jgi:hypothetical protein